MIVAEYDEQWAYMSEDDEGNKIEVGYHEEVDQMDYDYFKECIHKELSNRKLPLVLRANNSNWRGQTGFATVDSIDELIGRVMSFDSSYYELHKTRGSAYHFKLSTHDCPLGFTIDVLPISKLNKGK